MRERFFAFDGGASLRPCVVLIAEARDLGFVIRLLVDPSRVFLVPFGRSLLPLLDCRFLLLDRFAQLLGRSFSLQGRKLLQIIAIKNAHIRRGGRTFIELVVRRLVDHRRRTTSLYVQTRKVL